MKWVHTEARLFDAAAQKAGATGPVVTIAIATAAKALGARAPYHKLEDAMFAALAKMPVR